MVNGLDQAIWKQTVINDDWSYSTRKINEYAAKEEIQCSPIVTIEKGEEGEKSFGSATQVHGHDHMQEIVLSDGA